MLKPFIFLCAVVGSVILAEPACAQAGNDSFAGRLSVNTDEMFRAGVTGSTFEEFDPAQMFAWLYAKGGSKWWSWTASTTGFAVLTKQSDTNSFIWPPVFAVYTGNDLPSLELVNWSQVDVSKFFPEFVGFNSTAGQTYSLGMAGESSDPLYSPFVLTESDSPIIVQQPVSQTLNAGDTALFIVISPSLPAGHAQWQFKGGDIPNETNSTLTIQNVTSLQAGNYTVMIDATNNEGVLKRTVSAPATLSVSGEILLPTILIRNSAGTSNFFATVLGQAQQWHRIESTFDFITWQTEPIDFAIDTVDSGHEVPLPSASGQTKFFRAHSLGNAQQSCVANLKKVSFAKERAFLEHHHKIGFSFDPNELKEYIGDLPHCPQGGTYTYNTFGTPPICSLAVLGHTL